MVLARTLTRRIRRGIGARARVGRASETPPAESGSVARVFLGSRAAKIIRHTPVPVLVVPRGAAESHRH